MITNDPDVPKLQQLRRELAQGVKEGKYTQLQASRMIGLIAEGLVRDRANRKVERWSTRSRRGNS